MKRILTYIFLFVSVNAVFAQFTTRTDPHSTGQNTIIRIDRSSQNDWIKDYDPSTNPNIQLSGNENVGFYSTPEGIFINILSGTNKIKLFRITGQLLLNCENITQGRFFIPTRKGIYFLKINNTSYKAICR